MTNPSEKALSFEARKIAFRHTKDGHVISFAIHPDETPIPVMQSFIGTRYMVALVEIGDDDQPVHATGVDPKTTGHKAVASANLLCKEPKFQRWLYDQGYGLDVSEDGAVDGLYAFLGIGSRSQLMTDEDARRRWFALVDEFKARNP